MCLLLNNNIKHITKEDIKCYKVLLIKSGQFVSPVAGMVYEKNKKYYLNKYLILMPKELYYKKYSIDYANEKYTFVIEAGFYSFHYKKDAFKFKKQLLSGRLWLREHSVKVFECCIPRGGCYYISENNQIVSDKIIIKEEL